MTIEQSGIVSYLHLLSGWTEKHAGLAAWVGALGAILAIFATWLLARQEYNRARKQARVRRNAEIDLIGNVISDFHNLVTSYIDIVDTKEALNYYRHHNNDPEWHAAKDLAFIPVTQWPSLAAYTSFKRYWFLANRLLGTSDSNPIDVIDAKVKAAEYERRHDTLTAALTAARE